MTRSTLLLALVSCSTLDPVEPDDPCLEAGYAIAWVVEACTGDVELANARFSDFERDYRCIGREVDDPELAAAGVALRDLYGCSFAIRQLPCELVADYGADLDRYLDASDACGWIVEPAGEEP